MATTNHLWAVGFDDVKQASKVRDEIVRLGRAQNSLLLDDVAVAVRHRDGSFTLERERLEAAPNVLGLSAGGFLAGLGVGVAPFGAAIRAAVAGAGTRGGMGPPPGTGALTKGGSR